MFIQLNIVQSVSAAVHYENHAPFAQVTELEREIDVSHWGTVYFEERYSLVSGLHLDTALVLVLGNA